MMLTRISRALSLLLLSVCGCAIARPFRGPGYDRSIGVTRATATKRVVVVVTHASLDPDARGPFDEQTARIVESLEADRHPGLIGFSTRRQLFGDEVWSMTVWTDEEALAAFLESEVHRTAIAVGGRAILRLESARREIPARDVPISWDRAIALLAEQRAP